MVQANRSEENSASVAGDAWKADPPAIKMSKITKSFGGVLALENVDLEVRHGQIHALLGGNGAGKSTLLKILRGIYSPDNGSIEVNGQPMLEHSSEASRRAGIAMIFQEMSLIPSLSAAQNIFLNREPKDKFGLIDDSFCLEEAKRLFEEFNVDIEPGKLVSRLGTGQCQLIEIIKALSQRSDILILDEPTTALSDAEVDLLFEMLRRLKASGVAIVYVSHRMDEILRIADHATILRDGHLVLSAPIGNMTVESIVGHVVGKAGTNLSAPDKVDEAALGEDILQLINASGAHTPCEVDLTVRRGEVVGIAGLLGSGRSSLARMLYGVNPLRSGEIRINGNPVKLNSPEQALKNGVALIPEDRLRQGLVVQHSVSRNICLSVLDRISNWGWVSSEKMAKLVNDQIAFLHVKTDSPETKAKQLSGGNQQKVVLAKGLATEPEILILDEPTAGIDIGSKTEVVNVIRQMAAQNKAVILISSEIAELIAGSDRIIVMADGRIKKELGHDDLFPQNTDKTASFQEAQRRLQVAIQEVNANV
ncbi:sugar ABC transporter ATP-binding protein [Cohaesibacter marisflavi]|uniref:sugar ABC transporter ATP-binding protein n=1 Tax=Cohaesibacter marisflavi TaxID=655353 RepID=UPI0029C773A0|nr:sugar ABC transporter ATP-binding protein [Cohaesibacter marisflavi]